MAQKFKLTIFKLFNKLQILNKKWTFDTLCYLEAKEKKWPFVHTQKMTFLSSLQFVIFPNSGEEENYNFHKEPKIVCNSLIFLTPFIPFTYNIFHGLIGKIYCSFRCCCIFDSFEKFRVMSDMWIRNTDVQCLKTTQKSLIGISFKGKNSFVSLFRLKLNVAILVIFGQSKENANIFTFWVIFTHFVLLLTHKVFVNKCVSEAMQFS